MGVATNTSNSITPPDLRGSFIYGQSSAATSTKVSGGAANVTLAVNNLPSHSHTATDSGHTHINTLTDPGHGHSSYSGSQSIAQSQNGLVGGSGNPPVVSAGTIAYNNTTGITITNASSAANITVGNTGNGTSFSVLPPYTSMNYIIKY
jgi:microcystin-dependent protein